MTVRVLLVQEAEKSRLLGALAKGGNGAVVVAATGAAGEAVGLTELYRPDLVILDLFPHPEGGIAAVEEIMDLFPTPILLLSREGDEALLLAVREAVRRGALEVLDLPSPADPSAWAEFVARLLQQVQLVARIKVIRHLRRRKTAEKEEPRTVLAIGASTGGPKAVMTILKALPRNFQGAICLVQHIADGCDAGFAQWLSRECRIPVRLATDGSVLAKGEALVAPNGFHMSHYLGRVHLHGGPPVNSCRPSIDVMFESLAQESCRHVVGVLLTGMGRDGARGLLAIKQQGGATIVQDQKTSAIYGMPKAAIELGAADDILPLARIPEVIAALFRSGAARKR